MTGQDSQSYLSKLSPWSRSPTVQPSKGKDGEPEPLLRQRQGPAYVVNHRHRHSLRRYPADCPPLRPQWFHAVDSPKRAPNPAGERKVEKPLAPPKKFAAFSTTDSKAIEAGYRRLAELQDAGKTEEHTENISLDDMDGAGRAGVQKDPSDKKDDPKAGRIRVPVNEDYLFDVDVERRELAPAYWLGPVYDVRRGSWFFQDGSVQRPCDENLAEQLEDGYLKVKPWRLAPGQAGSKMRSSSQQPRARPISWAAPAQDTEQVSLSVPMTPKGSNPDLRRQALEDSRPPTQQTEFLEPTQIEQSPNSFRLFGAHMNSVVTYQDADVAWLVTDDFVSRMNYSVYQRFAGGGHFAGLKIVRGYVNDVKTPEAKHDSATDGKDVVKDPLIEEKHPATVEDAPERQSTSEIRRQKLERHMSSLFEGASTDDAAKQEEELKRRNEREIEEDYQGQEGDEQGREIEHLILVTHGIGQRLGLRIDAVNFVHDVNTLRKTIKAVYADSPDLRALNAELDETEQVNSRIQVLPICWRHLLDFPKHSLKRNRKEHDLADTEVDEEDYPSLDDITVDGVPAVRNLITDLALDILLYQSPAYKDHISRIVLEECNRIYHLFMERNPNFKGKVSFIGHSLGSAVMFDLLCRQAQPSHHTKHHRKDGHDLRLDFAVEDFYALGSPIGLFQMLRGSTIRGRETASDRKRAASTSMDDPMLAPSAKTTRAVDPAAASLSVGDTPFSSPQCARIFNIFHPTDPISYRIEPLISPMMKALKPQPLPYTKRGIFGAPMGQGLSGIGVRVSQSVSSMWSSMASSLLTRGLGYTGNEPAQLPSTTSQRGGPPERSSAPLSLGAGTNIAAGVVPTAPLPAEGTEIARIGDDKQNSIGGVDGSSEGGKHPPTLIDADLETLYAGFRTRRKSVHSDSSSRDLGAGAIGSAEWQEIEEQGKRVRREEEKVRKLNSNGRVDYAIQEGAFDINLIAAIASHLSYWSDEDVSHFMISQLLSRHRVVRPVSPRGPAVAR